VAGIKIADPKDLLQFIRPLLLPSPDICRAIVANPNIPEGVSLAGQGSLCIPLDAAAFNVQGACFTGPTQIKWLSQLLALGPEQAVLHMDGKYKLHHGQWVLLTLGSHMLKSTGVHKVVQLGTTFVPLVYLFCQNHESVGLCSHICRVF